MLIKFGTNYLVLALPSSTFKHSSSNGIAFHCEILDHKGKIFY